MKKLSGKDRANKYAFGGDIGGGKRKSPSNQAYTTQAQVDAANATAQRLAKKHSHMDSSNVMVASKPGDPMVRFHNERGMDITGAIDLFGNKPLATKIPQEILPNDIQSDQGAYWYTDPHTGDTIDIDPTLVNLPRFKKDKTAVIDDKLERSLATKKISFALGGQVGMGLLNQAPGLLNNIISLFEGQGNQSIKQPILDASTMRGMVNPYSNFALGGETDDINNMGLSEDEMMQLQAMADEQNITVEELIQMMQSQQNNDNNNDGDSNDIEQDEQGFAYGGKVGKRKIEVEGNEAIETPSGQVGEIKGPSHSQGGVKLSVPNGTKIFSDRIKIDGKTMAERKLAREKRVAKVQKLLKDKPYDKLLQATVQRTSETTGFEDQKDMQVQRLIKKIYSTSIEDNVEDTDEYAFGGQTPDPYFDKYGWNYDDLKSILQAGEDPTTATLPVINGNSPAMAGFKPGRNNNSIKGTLPPANNSMGSAPTNPGFTTGDYVGMAGNLFNAIAPLANTQANAARRRPNVNRWQGFGQDAIDANDDAQDIVGRLRSSTLTDIDTAEGTSRLRNRNSATSVNTIRALDTVSDMQTNKAKNAANDSFSRNIMNLLGQRSQLENQQDTRVMAGESARDIEDKADTDNYYSNKAQNLVNFGTNIQGLGRNLNTAKQNQVDNRLLSQLSQYGLQFDEEGNLISSRS